MCILRYLQLSIKYIDIYCSYQPDYFCLIFTDHSAGSGEQDGRYFEVFQKIVFIKSTQCIQYFYLNPYISFLS